MLLAPISRTAARLVRRAAERSSSRSQPSGQPGTAQPVALAAGLLTTYAKNHVAIAGSTLVDGTITDRSHSTVALGTAGGASEPRTASAAAPAST